MKKTIHLLCCILILASVGVAQPTLINCNNQRYDTEVFPNVTINSDITYGSNFDSHGSSTTLTMDVYTATGDTASNRPLIIWAHGGSFIGGTKNDVDVVALSNHFAKRGYVCASINYRLGILPNQASATQGVYRAVQDMRAAIRFFRKDAATTNSYKINPNMVFAGGSSAGAFTALHLAYMDQPSELPVAIDTMLLGGIEGNSGNPGYPSHVNAVINLCGALGDTSWMHVGDVPVCSMHGTNDIIVPYATDLLYLFGSIPILIVNGSYSLSQYANATGISNAMYTYYGGQHVPYVNNVAYMDTTVRFVSNFLYSYMGCTPADPNPLPNTFMPVSTQDGNPVLNDLAIYPNPAVERVTVQWNNSIIQKLELKDITGRLIKTIHVNSSSPVSIDRGGLSSGLYFLKIFSHEKTMTAKICFR